MKIVEGKYNCAKVFTDRVEESCIGQIKGLLDLEAFQGTQVRIMPDCHTGAGCVIGFTADLGDKIIPNIVGVDIGCGMLTVELGRIDIDLERFDRVVRNHVPSGREVHEGRLLHFDRLKEMDDIVENIGETAKILRRLRPVYNFKANSTTVRKTGKDMTGGRYEASEHEKITGK